LAEETNQLMADLDGGDDSAEEAVLRAAAHRGEQALHDGQATIDLLGQDGKASGKT